MAAADGLTVVEAIARYWRHAKAHYVKAGRPTGEQHGIKSALRFVRELYGDTPAADFSPIALKAVRPAWSTPGSPAVASTNKSVASSACSAGSAVSS